MQRSATAHDGSAHAPVHSRRRRAAQASAGVFRFFVEGVGAGLAAETAYAVERLVAIPARPLGRQAQTGGHRCGANRSAARGDNARLGRQALVRRNFLYHFHTSTLTVSTYFKQSILK